MSKELCKLKKSLSGDLSHYITLVDRPTHVCTKCGRVANEKKLLCRPKKMGKISV